ncbi:MAG: META domain-containing protein [Chloroflexota bacterium]
MFQHKRWALLIWLCGLILAACTANTAPPVRLDGTSWAVVSLGGQPLAPNTQGTISFGDGALHGSDGCNRYSTTYTVVGAKLTVNKQIASTMMACSEPVMRQASAFLQALPQVASYRTDGQQLTLLDGRGRALMTLEAPSMELGGTAWRVTGYNNGRQAVVSVLAGVDLTANLGADGRLTGWAGCNTYTASYEASGTTIQIGPAPATRKVCAEPAGVMDQEAQYLRALETAATFSLDGDTLELRTADGALVVAFTRAR